MLLQLLLVAWQPAPLWQGSPPALLLTWLVRRAVSFMAAVSATSFTAGSSFGSRSRASSSATTSASLTA